jgi:hypothetical protein
MTKVELFVFLVLVDMGNVDYMNWIANYFGWKPFLCSCRLMSVEDMASSRKVWDWKIEVYL